MKKLLLFLLLFPVGAFATSYCTTGAGFLAANGTYTYTGQDFNGDPLYPIYFNGSYYLRAFAGNDVTYSTVITGGNNSTRPYVGNVGFDFVNGTDVMLADTINLSSWSVTPTFAGLADPPPTLALGACPPPPPPSYGLAGSIDVINAFGSLSPWSAAIFEGIVPIAFIAVGALIGIMITVYLVAGLRRGTRKGIRR